VLVAVDVGVLVTVAVDVPVAVLVAVGGTGVLVLVGVAVAGMGSFVKVQVQSSPAFRVTNTVAPLTEKLPPLACCLEQSTVCRLQPAVAVSVMP
jgi:hypothetical protein